MYCYYINKYIGLDESIRHCPHTIPVCQWHSCKVARAVSADMWADFTILTITWWEVLVSTETFEDKYIAETSTDMSSDLFPLTKIL